MTKFIKTLFAASVLMGVSMSTSNADIFMDDPENLAVLFVVQQCGIDIKEDMYKKIHQVMVHHNLSKEDLVKHTSNGLEKIKAKMEAKNSSEHEMCADFKEGYEVSQMLGIGFVELISGVGK